MQDTFSIFSSKISERSSTVNYTSFELFGFLKKSKKKPRKTFRSHTTFETTLSKSTRSSPQLYCSSPWSERFENKERGKWRGWMETRSRTETIFSKSFAQVSKTREVLKKVEGLFSIQFPEKKLSTFSSPCFVTVSDTVFSTRGDKTRPVLSSRKD